MPVRRNGFGRDDYRTPPALIEYIHEQILPSLALPADTQYYDPAAGDGRLLEPVCAATVHNFDVCPRAEGVREQNFLSPEIVRPTAAPLCVVMNPPYGTMPVQFLNQLAQRIMRPGEFCVAIMPVTMAAWTRISEVEACMHLVQHHVPARKVVFQEHGHRKKKIAVAIQVWQLRTEPMRRFPACYSSDDFAQNQGFIHRTCIKKGPHGCLDLDRIDFLVRRNGTVRDLGLVVTPDQFTCIEEKPNMSIIHYESNNLAMRGTVRTSGGGTFAVIKAKQQTDQLRRRFEELYRLSTFVSWYGEAHYACGSLPPTHILELLYIHGPQPLDQYNVHVVHMKLN